MTDNKREGGGEVSDDFTLEWPKHYRALPPGYEVRWVECVEHFMGIGPDEVESPIFCDRYMARRWCFAHHAGQAEVV